MLELKEQARPASSTEVREQLEKVLVSQTVEAKDDKSLIPAVDTHKGVQEDIATDFRPSLKNQINDSPESLPKSIVPSPTVCASYITRKQFQTNYYTTNLVFLIYLIELIELMNLIEYTLYHHIPKIPFPNHCLLRKQLPERVGGEQRHPLILNYSQSG